MSELHTHPRPPGVWKGGRTEPSIQGRAEPLMLSTGRVSASDAEKQALKTQALGLSLNYSFVTPLTSMVVTKPEGQEQSQVAEKPVENGVCDGGLRASVEPRLLTQCSPRPLPTSRPRP